MRCQDWIIEVEGVEYAIDETFGGDPAIFHLQSEEERRGGYYRHINTYPPEVDEPLIIIVRRIS